LLSALATFIPLALLMLRSVDGLEVYGLAGTVATFGFLTAYILISVAAPMYLRARGRLTARDMAISILAVIAMGVALLGSLYPVPPAPYSSLPYIYAGLLLAGFTWSMIWNARSPIPMHQIQSDLRALAD
jgi:hypothetical protein